MHKLARFKGSYTVYDIHIRHFCAQYFDKAIKLLKDILIKKISSKYSSDISKYFQTGINRTELS
jgi:hypothetical protein